MAEDIVKHGKASRQVVFERGRIIVEVHEHQAARGFASDLLETALRLVNFDACITLFARNIDASAARIIGPAMEQAFKLARVARGLFDQLYSAMRAGIDHRANLRIRSAYNKKRNARYRGGTEVICASEFGFAANEFPYLGENGALLDIENFLVAKNSIVHIVSRRKVFPRNGIKCLISLHIVPLQVR